MIISRTPFRISFFGGGTDFPEYFRQHGGAVLVTTIDQFCYLSIHSLSPFFRHRFRASYAKTESVVSPQEFEHPLVRECLLHLDIREGLEISHVADLPGRTGLGTSSSFTVGLLNALHAFRGDRTTAEDLAREAIDVERTRVGDAGGHQDQYIAAYGGFLRIDFEAHQVRIRRLTLPHVRVRELEDRLLLFYTGIEQPARDILAEQTSRTAVNTEHLRALRALVDTAEGIVTGPGELDPFGALLHRTWELKKKLAGGISNPLIDRSYEVARSAGAVGGKLLGAGGRGFLLLYAPPARHGAIRDALVGLQPVPFHFSDRGSEIIFATDSTGVRNERWAVDRFRAPVPGSM